MVWVDMLNRNKFICYQCQMSWGNELISGREACFWKEKMNWRKTRTWMNMGRKTKNGSRGRASMLLENQECWREKKYGEKSVLKTEAEECQCFLASMRRQRICISRKEIESERKREDNDVNEDDDADGADIKWTPGAGIITLYKVSWFAVNRQADGH